MAVPVGELRGLLFGDRDRQRRFTQDSPILPEVWFAFAERERVELLLTPHAPRQPAALAYEMRLRLGPAAQGTGLVYTNTYVAANLTFAELIRAALPLSRWWRAVFGGGEEPTPVPRREEEAAWFAALAKAVGGSSLSGLLDDLPQRPRDAAAPQLPLLFSVTLNRTARPAVARSVPAVKADAARRVFQPVCSGLRWAVIDSGVDAEHPALARRRPDGTTPDERLPASEGGESWTRVWRTYDFVGLRAALMGESPRAPATGRRELPRRDPARELKRRLKHGQAVDWDLVAAQLEVPHVRGRYEPPEHEHGTHVAGILAGHWPAETVDGEVVCETLDGVCPDLELLDLRVLDTDGTGSEFCILGALQFVRHLNSRSERRVVHGVNLSFSLDHDPENYACGRTPLCEEVERLVKSGVVVVAAAGNEGWARFHDPAGRPDEGYRALSITDPGNAESAITVGATHRHQPHVYGVSYFSSRGPTGDGRSKPDLVAPGEKIEAPIPNGGSALKDGTSMAAPHVSGAAALLMARHDELVGDPETIKRILCTTATDLGRERYFQGAGMLDILRAMQAH